MNENNQAKYQGIKQPRPLTALSFNVGTCEYLCIFFLLHRTTATQPEARDKARQFLNTGAVSWITYRRTDPCAGSGDGHEALTA